MTGECWRIIFAKKLSWLLWKYDMNQSDLAKRLGVIRSIVSMYITAQRNPSMNVLFDISEIFGCDFEWLVGGKE